MHQPPSGGPSSKCPSQFIAGSSYVKLCKSPRCQFCLLSPQHLLGIQRVCILYIYIWVNYNDLTATSLESWLIREIIPKWPSFSLVKYYNLPRYYIFIYLQYISHISVFLHFVMLEHVYSIELGQIPLIVIHNFQKSKYIPIPWYIAKI